MKRALVTGSSQGIGKALVDELLAQGYFVYATMRTPNPKLFSSSSVRVIALDVQSDDTIIATAQTVMNDGPLDLLINNAGVFSSTTPGATRPQLTELQQLDRTALHNMLDINTISPIIVAKYFAHAMNPDGSFIVNITSDQGSFTTTSSTANYGYRASKVALNMMTQSLAYDLPANIRVCAIHPGWVKTANNQKGIMSPSESAAKILHIIDNWDDSMIGAYLDSDGRPYPR